jgi:hypothetical protein
MAFRNAFPLKQALDKIKNPKYDPGVVDVCLRLFGEKGYKMEG